MKQFSIVLPIVMDGNGYMIFQELGLPSFYRHLNLTHLDKFYIVAPLKHIATLNLELASSSIPFSFIPEELLIGNIQTTGWYKQQIIKLCMARVVRTSIYLVVDSDMYLTQSLEYDDLFDNDRLKYNYEPWQTINSPDFSQNSKWWDQSCSLLECDITTIQNSADLMSVTPQTFIVDIVKGLITKLESKFQHEWPQRICDLGFTEFTLYWLYVLSNNYKDKYTVSGYPLWTHNRFTNILDIDLTPTKVTNSMTAPSSYFGVIQSYLPYKQDVLMSILKEGHRCLTERKKIDAIFIIAAMTTPKTIKAFTVQERYDQTLKTVRSAKKLVSNSICVLVEGSILSQEHALGYRKSFDIILDMSSIPAVVSSVNDSRNIGYGECKLIQAGIGYIVNNLLIEFEPRYIFKLGARYELTDAFSLGNFSDKKFSFKPVYDSVLTTDVYATGLFSIPVRRLREFYGMLDQVEKSLPVCLGVEHMYKNLIPLECIHSVDILGLTGALNYNGSIFTY